MAFQTADSLKNYKIFNLIVCIVVIRYWAVLHVCTVSDTKWNHQAARLSADLGLPGWRRRRQRRAARLRACLAVIRDESTTRFTARSEARQQENSSHPGCSDYLPCGRVRVALRTSGPSTEALRTPTKSQCRSASRHQQYDSCRLCFVSLSINQ